MGTKRFDIRFETRPQFVLETLTCKDGKKKVEKWEPPVAPYCFVKANDDMGYKNDLLSTADIHDCRIEIVDDSIEPAPDGYWRVQSWDPWAIRNFADGFEYETFESDVNYERRVMIDNKLQVDIPEPKDTLFFDIEVDPRGGFPDAEEAANRVISIAAVDGIGNEYFYCYDDEEQILREFFDLLDEYFVICGWNSQTFDWPYLMNRLQLMPFNYDPFEVIHLDIQYLFMHVNRTEKESFKLDYIGRDEVGMGKTMNEEDHELGYDVLWEWFENDHESLAEYNLEDCRIVEAINDKYKLTQIVFRICRRGFCRPSRLMYKTDSGRVNMAVGRACDSVILQSGKESGYVFPDAGKYADIHDFPGGKVIDPKPGVYDDIVTVDFSGMYPAIIRDFNIGPNSWVDESHIDLALEVANNRYDDFQLTKDDFILGVEHIDEAESDKARGCFLRPDIDKSVIADSLDDLEELRNEFKTKRNNAVEGTSEWHTYNTIDEGLKVLVNSMYGVAASPRKRYYVPGMSENITETGQHLIMRCKEFAESKLPDAKQVIYGDTDSIMIQMDRDEDDDIYETAKRIQEGMNEFIQDYVQRVHNSPGDYLRLDLDDIYERYLITDKKKKYAGLKYIPEEDDTNFKITGFRCVKANTSNAVSDYQLRLIKALLHKQSVGPIIQDSKDDLFKGKYDEDMVQHTRLNKMPSDYSVLQSHSRAAQMIIDREGDTGAVNTDDKIAYLKRGPDTKQVEPVDNGITDKRPNEKYCPECDLVIRGEHEHEQIDGPKLRKSEYSYLWESRFEPTLELLEIGQFNQTSLGAFA